MPDRKYYEAYEDRYRQVHQENLIWFSEAPSPIVAETISRYHLSREHKLLEIGCGEGRDAFPLLRQGFDLLATDISPEAISFCRERIPTHAEHFQTLDCITENLDRRFDFIYAVAVVHMLVLDEDRNAFYQFILRHLTPSGIGLVCSLGDGNMQHSSDIRTAFELQTRVHQKSGTPVQIAGTSCRMVNFETFEKELAQNGLRILQQGITSAEPDFSQMMFAVVSAL